MAKTSNSFPQFPDLSPDEVRQLCYIAYFGEDYGSAIPQYIKHFHKSRNTYDETGNLIRIDYLDKDGESTLTGDRYASVVRLYDDAGQMMVPLKCKLIY